MGSERMAEERYGLLPEIDEQTALELEMEVLRFSELMDADSEKARREVLEEVKWLEKNKNLLGRLVETGITSALSLISDKLSERDLEDLRIYLLKGVLLVLQGINLALKKTREVK